MPFMLVKEVHRNCLLAFVVRTGNIREMLAQFFARTQNNACDDTCFFVRQCNQISNIQCREPRTCGNIFLDSRAVHTQVNGGRILHFDFECLIGQVGIVTHEWFIRTRHISQILGNELFEKLPSVFGGSSLNCCIYQTDSYFLSQYSQCQYSSRSRLLTHRSVRPFIKLRNHCRNFRGVWIIENGGACLQNFPACFIGDNELMLDCGPAKFSEMIDDIIR